MAPSLWDSPSEGFILEDQRNGKQAGNQFLGSRLETAMVGFTCGPRVTKTGAAGEFTNMRNMTNKHDNSNAATSNDYAHSSNKSDKVIENEAKI